MNAIPLSAFNPGPFTGAGNWTWLIQGRDPTLVDAGIGEARHLDALEQALGGARLAQVLVSHAHTDHAGGAHRMAERFPGVRLRKMPWPHRDARSPVSYEPISDGDAIEAGDSSLVAVHTPGHAPDHLCFWHEPTRTLFGADLVVKGSTVWIPASEGGDLAAYIASLERIIALNPARILPAHGDVVDDPLPILRGYLDHRRERESQIVAALRQDAADLDALVSRVYTRLKPVLERLARESLLAHLVKLEGEGRARREGEVWHIMNP